MTSMRTLLGMTLVLLNLSGCGSQPSHPASQPGPRGDSPISLTTRTSPDTGSFPGLGRPDFQLPAEELAREFLDHPAQALGKYRNRRVQVEGRVATANPGLTSGRGFILVGQRKPQEKDALNLQCVPISNLASRVPHLGKGQKIQVVGRLVGANPLFISLDDCQFQEMEPSPVPNVSASEWSEEFNTQPTRAQEKFPPGLEIVVQGQVKDLRQEEGLNRVFLVGSGSIVVSANLSKEDFKTIRPGKEVTIKGTFNGYFPADHQLVLSSAFLYR